MKHFCLNVEALQRVLQAVHDVEHSFHRYSVWSLTEIVFHGNETYAQLLELNLHDGSIEMISKGSRTVERDDVLDFRMFVKVSEHLAENRPVGDRLRRNAGFDERLADYVGSDLLGFEQTLIALRGDG